MQSIKMLKELITIVTKSKKCFCHFSGKKNNYKIIFSVIIFLHIVLCLIKMDDRVSFVSLTPLVQFNNCVSSKARLGL